MTKEGGGTGEKIKISSIDDLGNELGLKNLKKEDIGFSGNYEVSKPDLDELKNKIEEVSLDQKKKLIKDFLETKKVIKEASVKKECTTDMTGFKADQLKTDIDSLKNEDGEKKLDKKEEGMSAKKDNAVKIPQNNPTTKINNPTKYQKNPSLMDDPKQWLNKHPIASIALAAGTAFVGYKLISLVFGGKDEKKEGAVDSIFEKIGIKGHLLTGIKSFGIIGLIAAVGIGLFLGKDKAGKIWDGISNFFGLEGESKEKKAAFEKFAKTIFDSDFNKNKIKINPETIKKIKGEKINEFLNFDLGVKYSGLKEEELNELKVIKDYIKNKIDNKELKVQNNSTIEDLVKKLSGNTKLEKEADKDNSRKILIGSTAVAAGIVGTAGALDNSSQQENQGQTTDNGSDELIEPTGNEKLEHNESTGYAPTILGARAYQFYHGVVKPYSELNKNERSVLKGSLREVYSRFFNKNEDYITAKQDLPKLKNELNQLKTQNLDISTNKIKLDFQNGIHSRYGNIDDILKNSNTEAAKALGYNHKGINTAVPDDVKMKYYKYLAELENKSAITLLEGKIKAIKLGPEAFKKFNLSIGNTDDLLKSFIEIENKNNILMESFKNADEIEAKQWKAFLENGKEVQRVIDEGNIRVEKIEEETKILLEESKTATPERKAKIDEIAKQKTEEIEKIKNGVKKVTDDFVNKNQKQMAEILDKSGSKRTILSRASEKWHSFKRDKKVLDIFDFNIVNSPKKKFFRFSLNGIGNKFILGGIVLATGFSAYDSKNGVNMDELKQTGTRVLAGFTPIYGTYLDAKDMVKDFSQGNILGGFANMGAMVASGAGDILLGLSIAGGVPPLGFGAKAGLGFLRSAMKPAVVKPVIKAGKTLNNARKVLKYGLIGGLATSLTLGIGVPLVSYGLNSSGGIDKTEEEPK